MKMHYKDLIFFLLVSVCSCRVSGVTLTMPCLSKCFAQPEIYNIYTTIVHFFFSGLVFPARVCVGLINRYVRLSMDCCLLIFKEMKCAA